MPTQTKSPATKFVSYRATLAEHRSIKASAAQMGITIGEYVAKAVATFRKAERAAKRVQSRPGQLSAK